MRLYRASQTNQVFYTAHSKPLTENQTATRLVPNAIIAAEEHPMASIAQINSISTKPNVYAKQAVLLTSEDHAAFNALTTSYETELAPKTPVDYALFSLIILSAWNIQRANRLEAADAMTQGVDPLLAPSPTLTRIASFRLRAERSFHKNLSEFRKLKAQRQPQSLPIQQKPKVKNEPNPIPKEYQTLQNLHLTNPPDFDSPHGARPTCDD